MDNKLQEAWAELVGNDRQKLAEFVVDYIKPNHLTNEYMSLLLNTRALNLGDTLYKRMRKGIEVRTLVPGAVHLASEVTVQDRVAYNLDGADVKVTYNEWDLERGDIGSLAEIRAEMRNKLSDYYISKVFTALSTIWNASNTPDNYTEIAGPLTEQALVDSIDRVNYRGGGAKVVIGTRRALQPVTRFGTFWDKGTPTDAEPHWGIPSALEEVRATGWVGRFYGVPVVGLNQIWDNPQDMTPLLPEDKVLVVGQNVGDFITYGPVRTKQWADMNPTPPQWYLELYQQFGMLVDNAEGIAVIDVIPS